MNPSHYDHAMAQGQIPQSVAGDFANWFKQMPGLKAVIDGLVSSVGALNINWLALAALIAQAIAAGGGPLQILIAILSGLGGVLNNPQAHALAASRVLVAISEKPHVFGGGHA